jgi:hypothetical protein
MPDVNIVIKARDEASRVFGGVGKSMSSMFGAGGPGGVTAQLTRLSTQAVGTAISIRQIDRGLKAISDDLDALQLGEKSWAQIQEETLPKMIEAHRQIPVIGELTHRINLAINSDYRERVRLAREVAKIEAESAAMRSRASARLTLSQTSQQRETLARAARLRIAGDERGALRLERSVELDQHDTVAHQQIIEEREKLKGMNRALVDSNVQMLERAQAEERKKIEEEFAKRIDDVGRNMRRPAVFGGSGLPFLGGGVGMSPMVGSASSSSAVAPIVKLEPSADRNLDEQTKTLKDISRKLDPNHDWLRVEFVGSND